MTNLPISGEFKVTATFGQQGKYWANGHKGLDIVCSNKKIYATCDGTVRVVAYDANGWGQYVSIGDDKGNKHLFCHLVKGSVKVVEGQKVSRTTVLGTMGTTGNSTGVHLHYQINNSNNTPINPCDHLGIPNAKGTYNSKDFQIRELYKDDKKIASWAKDAVYNLKEVKIMNGDTVGNFNPTNNITRQEMAVLVNSLCTVKGYAFPASTDPNASKKYEDDATIASWAKKAIYELKKKKLMSGDGTNFNPKANITRQEAAVLINNIYAKPNAEAAKYADDSKIAKWAKTAVYNLKQAGIMSGKGFNKFDPTGYLTRQEAAVLVSGLIKKK